MTTNSDPNEWAGPRKIDLSAEKETLLITLYAKAQDYRSKRSILHDAKADELVRSIDYDFERLKPFGTNTVLVARARQLDDWVREFIGSHEESTVLNLGCGLDTRVSRIGPPASVKWFDVDFPDVITVRRNFYSDGEGYRMLGYSITQPEWLELVPKDRPVMAVADGVLEYVPKDDVKALLNRVTGTFPSGQVAFDVMSSYALNRGNSELRTRMTGAELRWAVDTVSEVDAMDTRLRRTGTKSVFGSRYLPPGYRLAYIAVRFVPRVRNAIRLVRYDF